MTTDKCLPECVIDEHCVTHAPECPNWLEPRQPAEANCLPGCGSFRELSGLDRHHAACQHAEPRQLAATLRQREAEIKRLEDLVAWSARHCNRTSEDCWVYCVSNEALMHDVGRAILALRDKEKTQCQ